MTSRIICDQGLCVGCGACVVACMDEHDVTLELGQMSHRRMVTINPPKEGRYIQSLSVGCHHCSNSPCLAGCPTRAIYRDPSTQAVLVNATLCIGCRTCARVCPFDIPRYDGGGALSKCDLCYQRLHHGKAPTCVQVCPVQALAYQPIK